MDLKIATGKPGHMPLEGWHQFDDGRCAYVTVQGDNYQMQLFDFGEVTGDNFERLEALSRRVAWGNFAHLGVPGPSGPKLQPPQSQQK